MKARKVVPLKVAEDPLEEFERRREHYVKALTVERDTLTARLHRVEAALRSVGVGLAGRPGHTGRPRDSGATGKALEYMTAHPGSLANEIIEATGVQAGVLSRIALAGRCRREPHGHRWKYFPAEASPLASDDNSKSNG